MDEKILNLKFKANNNKEYSLKDFKGQKFILYFYPKDNTPGCTVQACDFTALLDDYKKAGYIVIGVSKDSIESHEKFINKHNLKHILLSDPDLTLHKELGAYGEKNLYGKIIQGVIRSTYIFNENLEIINQYKSIRAKGHAQRILKEITK